MGLDISAVSNIKIIEFVPEYDEDYDDGDSPRQDYINPHFPHAVPEDWQGEYVIWKQTSRSKYHGFNAGSYSGYGLFRSTLAQYSMDVDTYGQGRGEEFEKAWEAVYEAVDKPFFEVINFSDCEGVFYGDACDKLYNDFEMCRADWTVWLEAETPFPAYERDYFVTKYDNFTKAFALGRENGIVSFH